MRTPPHDESQSFPFFSLRISRASARSLPFRTLYNAPADSALTAILTPCVLPGPERVSVLSRPAEDNPAGTFLPSSKGGRRHPLTPASPFPSLFPAAELPKLPASGKTEGFTSIFIHNGTICVTQFGMTAKGLFPYKSP